MVQHQPVVFLGDVGPKDRRREGRMVARRVQIADVVQQRDAEHFLVGAVAEGARRDLQRMPQPVDLIAVAMALERLEQREHVVGDGHRIGVRNSVQPLILFAGAIGHGAKAYDIVQHATSPVVKRAAAGARDCIVVDRLGIHRTAASGKAGQRVGRRQWAYWSTANGATTGLCRRNRRLRAIRARVPRLDRRIRFQGRTGTLSPLCLARLPPGRTAR